MTHLLDVPYTENSLAAEQLEFPMQLSELRCIVDLPSDYDINDSAEYRKKSLRKAVSERRLRNLLVTDAKESDEGSAIAFAAGKPIPRNCLPPPTKKAEVVTGNQYLVLISLQRKAKKRADIAAELGAPLNSVSATLQTLKRRNLIRVQRKVKRDGRKGSPVCVYAISEAGRRAVEACDE